ncbi:MAG: RNA polymerase sigma factor [Erysipelotrichia bacterium]|nr:RNA polymerase sigma factor [Erysipelotrichia bacterium]
MTDFCKEGIDDVLLDECLEEIASDNMDGFRKLYELTSHILYGFSLSIVKDEYSAQDCLHDSYIKIIEAAKTYVSKSKPLAWMLTITRNTCLQRLRENKKQINLTEEQWILQAKEEDDVNVVDKEFLNQCLNQLDDKERQVIILHSLTGYKFKEIAQILKLPLSTVLSRHNRAIKKLQQIVKQEE